MLSLHNLLFSFFLDLHCLAHTTTHPKKEEMKVVAFYSKLLLLWLCFVSTATTVVVATLQSEWTQPLKEGDHVPDVEFMTRVRIESDDENPFDWKGMFKLNKQKNKTDSKKIIL